jgi:hypothetical protein
MRYLVKHDGVLGISCGASLRRARVFSSLGDLYAVDVTQPIAERYVKEGLDGYGAIRREHPSSGGFSRRDVLPRAQ